MSKRNLARCFPGAPLLCRRGQCQALPTSELALFPLLPRSLCFAGFNEPANCCRRADGALTKTQPERRDATLTPSKPGFCPQRVPHCQDTLSALSLASLHPLPRCCPRHGLTPGVHPSSPAQGSPAQSPRQAGEGCLGRGTLQDQVHGGPRWNFYAPLVVT